MNSFKNPCLSRNLDKSDMNALKVNYIQMERYSLYSCCQRFLELLLEMHPNACFEKHEMLRKRKITWIVVFQKPRSMSQSGLTIYLASGKVQEEMKTSTLRKESETIQSLETNILEMSAEPLNFWLTKFDAEVCKENGERYPPRSLYSICCGLQRHLENSSGSDAIKFLNKGEPR